MPVCRAKSRAAPEKVSLFSLPVIKDSISRACLSLLIPIIDAFIVFAERLFSAATKSDSLPPFQLKETFLSFTAYS